MRLTFRDSIDRPELGQPILASSSDSRGLPSQMQTNAALQQKRKSFSRHHVSNVLHGAETSPRRASSGHGSYFSHIDARRKPLINVSTAPAASHSHAPRTNFGGQCIASPQPRSDGISSPSIVEEKFTKFSVEPRDASQNFGI